VLCYLIIPGPLSYGGPYLSYSFPNSVVSYV